MNSFMVMRAGVLTTRAGTRVALQGMREKFGDFYALLLLLDPGADLRGVLSELDDGAVPEHRVTISDDFFSALTAELEKHSECCRIFRELGTDDLHYTSSVGPV